MIQLLTRTSACLFIMLAAGLPQRQAVAQTEMDVQPGVVISASSLKEHLDDIEHLFEAAGFGSMKGMVRIMTSEYIRGLDQEKPIGAMLFFEGDKLEPEVLAFVPVTDIDDVLDTIADLVDIEEDGDDTLLTMDDGTELTVRVKDGFAFVAKNPEMLDNVPSDPASTLGELPAEYNLSARVYGQRLPAEFRAKMIELIRESALDSMDEEGPQADLQRANFEYSMRSIESIINETDEIVAGFNIDEEGNRIYLDMKFVGLPDSRLARQCAAFADAPPSRFTGFLLDRAALNFHFCGKLLEEDIVQADAMIDELKSAGEKEIDKQVEKGEMTDGEAKTAKRILTDLLNVLVDSMKAGVIDMGGAAIVSEDSLSFATGLRIASGGKLEKSVKEIAELARAEGAPLEFRFDTATEDGIRFHEVDILVPENEEEARQFFGERFKLLLGVGDDVVYIAGGDSAKELLTECRKGSASESDLPAAQANFHLLPFLRFMAKFQDARELKMIADALPESADDRIRMTARMIENGEEVRMEMQEGLLEVFGKIGQSMGGGFAPPEDF